MLLGLAAAGTVFAVLQHESTSLSDGSGVASIQSPRDGVAALDTRIIHGIATQLRPVPIRTGFILTTGGQAEAPFEIRTPPGQNYYVKLVHRPSNSTWVAIYVEGGKSFYGEVPAGEFELRWAMGQTWYGLHDLFGPGTTYERAVELLRFESSGNGVAGHTIVFERSPEGNLISAPLHAKDF